MLTRLFLVKYLNMKQMTQNLISFISSWVLVWTFKTYQNNGFHTKTQFTSIFKKIVQDFKLCHFKKVYAPWFYHDYVKTYMHVKISITYQFRILWFFSCFLILFFVMKFAVQMLNDNALKKFQFFVASVSILNLKKIILCNGELP